LEKGLVSLSCRCGSSGHVEQAMFCQDLPKPILFHPLKHHLGYISAYIHKSVSQAPEVSKLKADLLSLGTSQLDLYCGPLSPQEIARQVILHLQEQELLQQEAFGFYLRAEGKDYRCLTLSDGTDWVLRWGVVEGRHVHLHPARYAAHTVRVKAATLKTAVATVIAAGQQDLPEIDLPLINRIRVAWLDLPPVKALAPQEGAGKFLQFLLQRL